MNTADYLLQVGADDDPAIITRGREVSYAQLRHASARLLGELLARGAEPGDHVGILAANSVFWAAAYLATLKLGAVAVPLPTVSTAEELQRKARFVNCRFIFADRRNQRRFSGVLDEAHLILDDILQQPGVSEWEQLATPTPGEQDAALMLTSGTTAQPRAVRVTHRNIQANSDSIVEYLGLDRNERMLVVLPFYYCFGTSLLHTHLRVGGSLVLCNTFAYPETALDMIESTQATAFAGVPSIYQTLLRNTSLPRRSLPTLRKLQQAGGKLPVVFIRELMAALPHTQIFIMYGQTEATARLSYLPPEKLAQKLGSVGQGIPGVTLRVLGDDGQPVKAGDVGEVYAWGENISPGYYQNEAASRKKFIDGALRTGDMATVDDEGDIFIVDRKSDFIKCLGHRVSSQEIEAHVLKLPQVVSAAAIGVPDDAMGEAIYVFLTAKSGVELSQEQLHAHCRKHFARHMWPKEMVVIDRLPLNANGKVVKSRLRAMLPDLTENESR